MALRVCGDSINVTQSHAHTGEHANIADSLRPPASPSAYTLSSPQRLWLMTFDGSRMQTEILNNRDHILGAVIEET